MIKIIKAEDRHFSDFGWLQTYWLFSFSNYYDAGNVSHGALCVFNDDVVQTQTGFARHPHEEMEIVSIILFGEMTHKDTMGNSAVIRQHDVQRMTAGTGLYHSEWNESSESVGFFQIWIQPDTSGLSPSYDQKNFLPDNWKNNLFLLASGGGGNDVVTLNTDAAIYRSELDGGHQVEYLPEPGRKVFVYVVNGSVQVNGSLAGTRSQVRISDENRIAIRTERAADFILIDVAGEKAAA